MIRIYICTCFPTPCCAATRLGSEQLGIVIIFVDGRSALHNSLLQFVTISVGTLGATHGLIGIGQAAHNARPPHTGATNVNVQDHDTQE